MITICLWKAAAELNMLLISINRHKIVVLFFYFLHRLDLVLSKFVWISKIICLGFLSC